MGSLVFKLDKRRKSDAFVNLDIAFPHMRCTEKSEIIKKCYINLLENAFEFLKNLNATKESIQQHAVLINGHIIEKLKKEGTPIILMTAHFGNWEVSPLIYAMRYGNSTVIGRESGNPTIDRIIKQSRERFGIKLINKKGAMRHIVRDLKNGVAVGVLVDQNTADNEGELIDFFAHKARHTPVASVIAKKYGAAIVPAFTFKNNNRYEVTFFEPITADASLDYDTDIHRLTQAQADITEKAIRQAPHEYFWFHRRWKNRYEERYKKGSNCLNAT